MTALRHKDALPHGHRRIRNRAEHVAVLRQHGRIGIEVQPPGDGDQQLSGKLRKDRRQHLLHLSRLHGYENQLCSIRQLSGIPAGLYPAQCRTAALQLFKASGTGIELRRLHRPALQEPLCDGRAHIAEADKADFHVLQILHSLPLPSVFRLLLPCSFR